MIEGAIERLAEACRKAAPSWEWKTYQDTRGFLSDQFYLRCRLITRLERGATLCLSGGRAAELVGSGEVLRVVSALTKGARVVTEGEMYLLYLLREDDRGGLSVVKT